MSSSKMFVEFILEQLSELEDITHRAMMGEYLIYYKGKVIGGIYDNRFLLKQTASAREIIPDAPLVIPYKGAKEMILVEDPENKEILKQLLNAMYDELPFPKKKKKKSE